MKPGYEFAAAGVMVTGHVGQERVSVRAIQPDNARGGAACLHPLRGLFRLRQIRRAWSRDTGGASRDAGQMLILISGFVALALLLVIVTTDITALHLQRQQLHALADAAALDAADALDAGVFYKGGARERPVALSDESVEESVRRYLANEPGSAGELAVEIAGPTGALSETTAEVTLSGRARIPLVSLVVRRWANGVPVIATSRATARPGAG